MFGIEGIAALVAKIGSASTVAHAAAGLGIAVVGVTGASAAGVLPGPLQDGVAGAVEAVTPFDLPTSDDVPPSTHQAAPDDERHSTEDPGAVPTTAAAPPAAPSSAHEGEHETETETEVEHATEAADGTHQHRSGAAATGTGSHDAGDESETHATEVEDSHGETTDDSGHQSGGDDTGGSGHGGDDGSGHGGGDG